jgi:hypothetical protein
MSDKTFKVVKWMTAALGIFLIIGAMVYMYSGIQMAVTDNERTTFSSGVAAGLFLVLGFNLLDPFWQWLGSRLLGERAAEQ